MNRLKFGINLIQTSVLRNIKTNYSIIWINFKKYKVQTDGNIFIVPSKLFLKFRQRERCHTKVQRIQ